METKRRMLACHVSQFEFMPKHFEDGMQFGTLHEPWNRANGEVAGCEYAEGFRQHAAPPFQPDNILVELIGAKHIRKGTSV